MTAGDQPFGLYVHWPYCRSKCPYCDFNSHVTETLSHDRWRAAYLTALDDIAPRFAGRQLASIFFGGGTPSLMAPETVAAVIAHARALWPKTPKAGPEITLEANPTSVEAAKFEAFRDAGVTRVSIGMQALDNSALSFLGREHSAKEALAALDIARKTFTRVNADMIYARPGQTVMNWKVELQPLLDRGLDHLSLYQLTIERGTPFFGRHRKGDFILPDEDTATMLYDQTSDVLETYGLKAYEISNYAKPGAECRHNLIYWRLLDYAGIGPGAHGRVPGTAGTYATIDAYQPDDWLARIEDSGSGRKEETLLTPRQKFEEFVMMGLRLTDGISEDDLSRIDAHYSKDRFSDAFNPARLERLVKGGFLIFENGRLRTSAAGRLRLDTVLADLLI
jgi:oxygen-independent coproporphyrinogen-3 oxidase